MNAMEKLRGTVGGRAPVFECSGRTTIACPGCHGHIHAGDAVCASCGIDVGSFGQHLALGPLYFNQGLELARRGRYSEALRQLLAASTLMPGRPEPFVLRIRVYALAGRYDSGWIYAGLLFVGYIGAGMYTPAANTLIADLVPLSNRPFAYTMNYVCNNLGMALGPLIAGFLAAYSYAWIFIGDVASSLICALLIIVGLRGGSAVVGRQQGGRRRVRFQLSPAVWLRHPMVLAFCLAYFFLISPLMGLEYAVPLLVKTVFMEKLSFVGAVYTVNAVCILALSFTVERLIRHRNEMLMMVIAGFFWTVGLVILLAGFSVGALLLCTAVWTVGEIIDSKCYFGVMKPGRGKPHRACAARCISGGVPPVLLITDRRGERRYLLLVGANGQALSTELVPLVAEPVEVEGEVVRSGDLWYLRADPAAIRRLAPS